MHQLDPFFFINVLLF